MSLIRTNRAQYGLSDDSDSAKHGRMFACRWNRKNVFHGSEGCRDSSAASVIYRADRVQCSLLNTLDFRVVTVTSIKRMHGLELNPFDGQWLYEYADYCVISCDLITTSTNYSLTPP
jgi:hypothetical protein